MLHQLNVLVDPAAPPRAPADDGLDGREVLLTGPLAGLFDDESTPSQAGSPLAALVLHAVHTADTAPLLGWLSAAGERLTGEDVVLDGAAGLRLAPGEHLSPAEVAHLVELVMASAPSRPEPLVALGDDGEAGVLVPCSLYAAVGEDDVRLLLARSVQLFTPGVPCLPVEELLPGPVPARAAAAAGPRRPVAEAVLRLIRLRREHPAFGGRFDCGPGLAVASPVTPTAAYGEPSPLTAAQLRARHGGPEELRNRLEDPLAVLAFEREDGAALAPLGPGRVSAASQRSVTAGWLRWVDGEHQVVLQIVPQQDAFRLGVSTPNGWVSATSVLEVCRLDVGAAA